MTTLTDLANRYNSDKGDRIGCCHHYTSIYEKLFEPYRSKPISFLEIGLQREFLQEKPDCPSLRMWLEFFSESNVSGFDITDFSGVDIPRARIFQGDQSNPRNLTSMAQEVGPFDIIIDDGSHASAHQQVTVATLFPYLKPGGLFVIEDAHWQPERARERQEDIETTQAVFKRWAVYGERLRSRFMTEEQCSEIEQNTKCCSFSHPFVDDNASQRSEPSSLRKIARRLLKGKKPRADHRNFKLIILEKCLGTDQAGYETVTAQLRVEAGR